MSTIGRIFFWDSIVFSMWLMGVYGIEERLVEAVLLSSFGLMALKQIKERMK